MEIFSSIVLIVLGIFFTLVGFQVFFHKNYSMINNFEQLKMRYRDANAYAKRLGLIQFISGCAELICGVASFFIQIENIGYILMAATIIPMFVAFMINDNIGLR